MEDTLAALEQSYLQLAAQEAVCRPRIDIRIPTSDPARNYQWGTMEGGSTAGYFAIRMKSDIIYEKDDHDVGAFFEQCAVGHFDRRIGERGHSKLNMATAAATAASMATPCRTGA